MLKFLVKKNEYNQIIVFGTLVRYKTISKSVMETQLECNSSTFSRYIRNINDDLITLFPNHDITIQTKGDQLILEKDSTLSLTNLVKDLSKKYLDESSVYHVLQCFLTKPKYEIHDFLSTINISQSYLNKIIKDLNALFLRTGVKIVQRNKSIYFDGPEMNLIFLSYLLQNYLEHFEAIPNPNIDSYYLNQESSLIPEHSANRLYTLFATFQKRSAYAKNLKIADPELKALLTFLLREESQLTTQLNLEHFSHESRLLFNFILLLTATQSSNPFLKSQLGAGLEQLDYPIITDTKALIKHLETEFSIHFSQNSSEYYQFFYIMTIHFIYLRLFGSNLKELFHWVDKDVYKQTQDKHPIYQEIEHFFNKNQNFSYLTPENQAVLINNEQLFIESTYTIIRLKDKKQVTISCNFIHRVAFEYFIKHYLHQIFNNDVLTFVSPNEGPDILVTDHIVEAADSTTLFTFVDTNSSEEMNELLNLITSLLTKKSAEN